MSKYELPYGKSKYELPYASSSQFKQEEQHEETPLERQQGSALYNRLNIKKEAVIGFLFYTEEKCT